MQGDNKIKLVRDCRAMMIPSGLDVTLAAGNEVGITHRLGGNFTVTGTFGMARIDGKDADALGLNPNGACEQTRAGQPSPMPEQNTATPAAAADNSQTTEKDLWEAARTVFDPEIPVNIVDLGLVYRMEMFDDPDGKRVEADITLTAPGCAMADDLKMRLESLAGVKSAKVDVVWDPPWHQDMMSEEARMILGLA